jgi:MHS family alpha-ketoglutarate permease-like MFS transporter
MLFGGSGEYVALWFKAHGHESWFFYYASAAIFISLIVYVTMPEAKRIRALNPMVDFSAS